MKTPMSSFARTVLLALPMAVAGCSFFTTTTDSVTSAVNSVTDTISSTTGNGKSASTFVDTRFAAIRFEAAKGEGEHLDSLAQLLGEQDRADFARFMQDNYAQLFTDLDTPQELLARIEQRRPRG
jgi:PBP1b-binding outer membrane lipoprotein LpoB